MSMGTLQTQAQLPVGNVCVCVQGQGVLCLAQIYARATNLLVNLLS